MLLHASALPKFARSSFAVLVFYIKFVAIFPAAPAKFLAMFLKALPNPLTFNVFL